MNPVSSPRLEVLVIDDDDDLRETIRQVIEEHGFSVCTANGADAALTHLAEGPRPQLILLDIAMPGMDGLALAAVLRQDASLVRIPVVIISAVVQGLLYSETHWATDVLTKPFQLGDLLRVVRLHCAAAAVADT